MRYLRFSRLCLFAGLAACSGGHPAPLPSTPPGLGAAPGSPITHVIFVVQENRTFDNIFGGPNGFPGADTASTGRRSDNSIQILSQVELECTYIIRVFDCPRQDPNNYHQPWLLACNAPSPPPFTVGGASPCRMNGFDQDQTSDLDPDQVYSYVDYSETTAYWDIAKAYTLGDHFFMGHNSESYTAHQYIFSAQSNNVVDGPVYPNPPSSATVFLTPWGCDSPAGTTTFRLDPATGQETSTASGPLPCFGGMPGGAYHSLADLVNAKQDLNWRLYSYSICQNINALDVNKSIRYGGSWPSDAEAQCPLAGNVSTTHFRTPQGTFLTDVANGDLANVTWVLPGPVTSDHPGVPFGYCGPWWVASIVDAVGQSKFWNSTVIFIFWDDWGGYYDHVPPYVVRDQAGPGFRVPLMVVSPYSKRGQVIHTNGEFSTLMQYTEENFGLGSLGQSDASPYLNDLKDYFDFSSAKPFVPITIPSSLVCGSGSGLAPGLRASKWQRLVGDD
jgi:phospholipase C